MAAQRLSRLQRQILRSLLAQDLRTQGRIAMEHLVLVQTLGRDKSNISHSLHTLETRGLIAIGRTPGGKAAWLGLTSAGRKVASRIPSSCE